MSSKAFHAQIGGCEFKVMRLNEFAMTEQILDCPEQTVAYLLPQLAARSAHFRLHSRPMPALAAWTNS